MLLSLNFFFGGGGGISYIHDPSSIRTKSLENTIIVDTFE